MLLLQTNKKNLKKSGEAQRFFYQKFTKGMYVEYCCLYPGQHPEQQGNMELQQYEGKNKSLVTKIPLTLHYGSFAGSKELNKECQEYPGWMVLGKEQNAIYQFTIWLKPVLKNTFISLAVSLYTFASFFVLSSQRLQNFCSRKPHFFFHFWTCDMFQQLTEQLLQLSKSN